MKTLRARIIGLNVAAILVVVAFATWLTFLMLDRPSFAGLADANALQIGLILSNGSKEQPGGSPMGKPAQAFGYLAEPAPGVRFDEYTDKLRAALQRRGLPADAVVTRIPGSPWGVASVTLGPGKVLAVPIAPPPPPDFLPVLLRWMLLIAAGTTAVTVAAVYRLTQPLALVEKSVASIGPEGELPHLPETGPAEVRATARAINLLSKRLQSAIDSRMRLVAAAGHDLRTPMTRMRLRAEFLEDAEREKWLADLDELDHIADSAIRLVREETSEADADPIRLDTLLGEAIDELRELRLNVRVDDMELAEVFTPPLALKRALRNLIINAATHGKGATVGLQRRADTAYIEISDHGPGIPDALLQRAFEPFFRVDPARSAGPGAGLGLAIAKEIIQRNGGRLTLVNAPAGGLIQTVELPVAKAPRL